MKTQNGDPQGLEIAIDRWDVMCSAQFNSEGNNLTQILRLLPLPSPISFISPFPAFSPLNARCFPLLSTRSALLRSDRRAGRLGLRCWRTWRPDGRCRVSTLQKCHSKRWRVLFFVLPPSAMLIQKDLNMYHRCEGVWWQLSTPPPTNTSVG